MRARVPEMPPVANHKNMQLPKHAQDIKRYLNPIQGGGGAQCAPPVTYLHIRGFICIYTPECDIRKNFDTNEYLNIFVSKILHEQISE